MKKIMSFALAIMLVATMSVTAFAEEAGNNKGTGAWDVPVSGTYQAGNSATGEKVSVDISWSEMSFTYTGASQGEWNPDNHNYKDGTAASWSSNKGSITVRNHSNCGITASFTFEAATGLNVKGSFYNKGEGDTYTVVAADAQKFDLSTAVGTTRDDQNTENDQTPTNTIYFGITEGSIADGTTSLGKIVVSIAKKASN